MKNSKIIFPKFFRSGKISALFRRINITLFLLISTIISIVIFFVLHSITDTVSKDYARLYSAETVGTLNTYFKGEIALITKAARSNAIINWFQDEDDQQKKELAYQEMSGIIDVLSSKNLYIGVEKTYHEYSVEEGFMLSEVQHFATLDPNYFDDAWYFECTSSDKEYLLNVDIDKKLHRKRVWLNHKVKQDDSTLGVLSTGLEFSSLVEELFSEYDNKSVRSLVIDENAVIHIDSGLLGNEDFLHYTIGGEYYIEDEFSDPALISTVSDYLQNINGYFDSDSPTAVVQLSTGPYRYATIAPIISTTWSVVTFYNASSLFNMTRLLPVFIMIPIMFIIFILATSLTSTKLIFAPFERLVKSISHLKTNMNQPIYGTARKDEIGTLANTIQSMKDSLIDALEKVHYDALTGIYNRRFIDETMPSLLADLSRSGDRLSVMMIDVDFFKQFNDTYGHSAGDDCLKTIAAVLAESIQHEHEFVARYGGEEFLIVLPGMNEYDARIIAERLLENVRKCTISHSNGSVSYVTISIGIAFGYVHSNQNSEGIINRADAALYEAKQSGRNRYVFSRL